MLADPADVADIKFTVSDLAEADEFELPLADPADRMLPIQRQPAKFRRSWIQQKQAKSLVRADHAAPVLPSRLAGLSSESRSSTFTNHH